MSASSRNPQQAIATFMASTLGRLTVVEAATAVVVGVPVDRSPGTGGGSTDGARAIREASLSILASYTASPSRTVLDLESGCKSRLKCPLACLDLGDIVVDEARGNLIAEDVSSLAQRIVGVGAMPVFIGGPRAVFAGLLELIAPGDDAAVLLVAHDLALPVRAKALPIASLGANGLQSQSDWDWVARSGTIILADQVHDAGIDGAVEALGAFVAEHQSIYCLVDMAVLDTGHAAGTADTNIGGLTPEQLVGVVANLDCSARLAGVALTNVAPRLDLRAQTEFAAAQVLVTLLASYLFEEPA